LTRPIAPPDPAIVARDVARALEEDLGSGDVTGALIPEARRATGVLTAKEAGVLAGRDWFDRAFAALDPNARVAWATAEGCRFEAGARLAEISGNARALLAAERTALNFLQTLSATATATAAAVAALAGLSTRVLDTRKTLPGLRHAQKYAVRVGGGVNHRIGLHDQYLVKENHIAAAGGIAAACAAARAARPDLLLEVEVESLDELDQALAAGADRIMLDDFDLDAMREAVRRTAGRAELEASGSLGLERLRAVAETGVDFVSIGGLTKHVRAVDLSLRIVAVDREDHA
jgi:nicotinate-nucleotide pyrophosphorylase (carboxylating)